jgi:acetolactate synthase-1/3 small subunit
MSAAEKPSGLGGTQTLVALVENRPGVLARVVTLLRRRHFDLHTLSMGRSEVPGRSRLTLTIGGDPAYARRVADNLGKLVEVLRVEVLADRPAVRRDLALIKIGHGGDSLAQVQALCAAFRAHVVDVSPGSAILEITGDEAKIERFRSLLEPFGVAEMARSECVAMVRGHEPPVDAATPAL